MPPLAPGQIWLDLVLVAYVAILMPVFSTLAGRALARNPDAPLIPRYVLTLTRGWIAVALLAGLWLHTGRDAAQLGLDWPVGERGRYGLAVLALAVVAVCVLLALLPRLITPARQVKLRERMRRLKILPRSTGELAVFILVSLTAGLWEELLFRGFLIGFLAPYVGVVAAALVSSVIFGTGHNYQGLRGVVTTGVIGVLFATGYLLTSSLWWLIGAHALLDLYGGLVAWRVMRMPAPA